MAIQLSSCGRPVLLGSLALTVMCGWLTPTAGAQVTREFQKLKPADIAAGDQLGYSIGTHNGLVVIGAVSDDDLVADSGSVYVFDGTFDSQFGFLLHELKANDAADRDNFGISVSIDGPVIAVGANSNDDLGDTSGSAYLFDTLTGNQLIKLLAPDGDSFDVFGHSVSLDGARVAVGAHGDENLGNGSGSAYIFKSSTEVFDFGALVHKVTPLDGQSGDFFGYSVSMDAGLLLVGAYGDDDNGSNSGSAYVFDAATGQQLLKLKPNDGAASDRFGSSVAIHNGVAVIGAPGDSNAVALSGSAYVFDAVTGQQLHKLVAGDAVFNQIFGHAVAIDGDVVAVSGINDTQNGAASGAAYLFKASTGVQFTKLLASDGSQSDQHGYSIAIHDETVAVGAWMDADYATFAGSAYLYSAHCPADVNGDGVVDNGDIGAFVTLFLAGSPAADFNGDSVVDNGDISAFIAAFLSGC